MKDITKYSIDAYVSHGTPLGHFLSAVMQNNLFEAFAHADEQNTNDMLEIVRYVYNQCPSGCHGSPAKVRDWYAFKLTETALAHGKRQMHDSDTIAEDLGDPIGA